MTQPTADRFAHIERRLAALERGQRGRDDGNVIRLPVAMVRGDRGALATSLDQILALAADGYRAQHSGAA